MPITINDDAVNHPSHYKQNKAKCVQCGTSIECIDVTRHQNFNLGNAIKYIWRADFKNNAIEDLQKAVWYLRDEIERRTAIKENQEPEFKIVKVNLDCPHCYLSFSDEKEYSEHLESFHPSITIDTL